MAAVITDLQAALEAHADPARKDWWTRYLKGTAAFRGVAMADIRAEVAAWLGRDGPATADARLDAAIALLRERLTEDKLAGVLLLAEHVPPRGRSPARPCSRGSPRCSTTATWPTGAAWTGWR